MSLAQTELAAQAQATFRAVLRAMSFPGRVITVPQAAAPEGLSPAAAAILLALTDQTVSVALPAPALSTWLGFASGARPAPPEAADFVVAHTRPPLAALAQGDDAAPEASATLIWEVPALAGPAIRLIGPGIQDALITNLPLDTAFLTEWAAQARKAPCGVDVILCAGRDIVALPRSVKLEAV